MRTLFGENVCENKRNGSGGGAPAAPPGSANGYITSSTGDPYQVSVNSWLEQRQMLNLTLKTLTSHPVMTNISKELNEVHMGLDMTGNTLCTDEHEDNLAMLNDL